MSVVNWVMTRIFDALFAPFVNLPPWISLFVFSIVLGIAGVCVYKYTSNQTAIRSIKNRIKADILAIKLFKDEPAVMFRSCGDALRCSVAMLRYSLAPLAVMIVPFVLVVAQLGLRYQWRPARPGEDLVLRAELSEAFDVAKANPTLNAGEGILVTTPAVRVPSRHEAFWRIQTLEPGRHRLLLRVGDDTVEKSVTVGDRLQRVSAARTRKFWSRLLHPAEGPITAESPVETIAVAYPARDSWFCGSTIWVFWLVALSFAAAWLLKPVFRVEF